MFDKGMIDTAFKAAMIVERGEGDTARITYKALKEITDLVQFVHLFETALRFDDAGLTIVGRARR